MNRILKRIQAKLKRQAEWVDVDINNHDITIILTDAMIQNSICKINYQGSGWRNILPYGWYITKDNNVILYCYKEDYSIRSYRLDRIINLMVDDKLDTKELEKTDMTDFEILELPENNDEIMEVSENEQGAATPFDESLEILDNDFVPPQQFESDWRVLDRLQQNYLSNKEVEENEQTL